jgi:hypothetical protein
LNLYIVRSLEQTNKHENNFDYIYHKKYVNRIAEEADHSFKTGVFKDFKLLIFEKDESGKIKDADWIHKNDLERGFV